MPLTRPDASQIAVQDSEQPNLDAAFRSDRNRPPAVIAHRGFADQGPQNTLLAFSRAINRGAFGVECDVAVSADGVLYCFHDTTVDALTDGTGTFTALTSSYIDGLEFTSTAGTFLADMQVTRFEELLKLVAEHGVELHAELKSLRTNDDIELIVDAIEAAGVTAQTTLYDGSTSTLAIARQHSEGIVVCLLGSTTVQATYESAIRAVAALGRAAIAWNYKSLLATPAIADYARSRGVDVITFTLSNQENMARLGRIGVRKVIADVSLVPKAHSGDAVPGPSAWLDGFKANQTRDGVASVSGQVATLTSSAGGGSAFMQKFVKSSPGETLTVSVIARRISGVDDTSGALKVEYPIDSPGEESVKFITSPEWREYQVTIGAGPTESGKDHFNIAVGTFTADGGQIQVATPRISIAGSRHGAARVHAYGLVRIASGVASIDSDYVSAGIVSAAYDVPSKTLSLTTPRGITGITAGAAPLLFCQITTEAGVAPIVAKIGEYVRGTGVCKVKFYNTTTGAEVDISGSGTFYVSVMLVI